MPAVFVHGVPDTTRVWDAVLSRLHRADTVTLALPGFGVPLPSGFEPTKAGYVGWLLESLAALPRPIDLVGHDWGALLVIRAVSLEPELVRTWAVARRRSIPSTSGTGPHGSGRRPRWASG